MYADRFFVRYLSPLAGTPGLRFLQIGAFTGDASVWMLENILTGDDCALIDVDTWQGSDEGIHRTFDWEDVRSIYCHKVEKFRDGRLYDHVGTSEGFFESESLYGVHGCAFDFVYIDGSHDSYDVLNDAVNAYRVLKVGGLLAFDDYNWQTGHGAARDPKTAIDAFAEIYGDRLELLTAGPQAWFRRVA
jgi:SAM-dependent methyltransferase